MEARLPGVNSVTVISDPGVDDAVALALLDKLAGNNQKLLIATYGNNTASITTQNAKEFVAFAANKWAYRQGARLPLNGKVEHPWPVYFHGADGFWGVRPPASAGNRAIHSRRPADRQVISLGPLAETYKQLTSGTTDQIMIMGGAFQIPGNETPYAEVNIAFDADAAAGLFASCQGVHVRVVPLDITRQTFWSLEQVQAIPETSAMNCWLKQLILAWFAGYNHEKENDFNLADPLAVFLAFYPELATWTRSGITVAVSGMRRGQTSLSRTNPVCDIALALPNAPAVAQQIYQLLFF